MTIKGKIFAALFFAAIGFSGGVYVGFKNAPVRQETVIENTIKAKRGSSVDMDQSNDVAPLMDNSRKKRKDRRKSKRR